MYEEIFRHEAFEQWGEDPITTVVLVLVLVLVLENRAKFEDEDENEDEDDLNALRVA